MNRSKHRLFGVWIAFVVAVVPGVVLITAPAGAATVHGARAAIHQTRALDLSSRAAVARVLSARGVNPKTAVWQRGARNYAGPNCPGVGWTCTSSANAPVVQIAALNGQNKFQCTQTTPPTNPNSNTCVVVQVAISGDNVAVCIEDNSDDPSSTSITQSCSITQTNVNGDNKATVQQKITQKNGTVQDARQHADVVQINTNGKNTADINQYVDQDSNPPKSSSAVSQDQNVFQDVSVPSVPPPPVYPCDVSFSDSVSPGLCQFINTGGTGNNKGSVKQQAQQKEHAETTDGFSVDQRQNDDGSCPISLGFGSSCPNQFAGIEQIAHTGTNEVALNQNLDQQQDGKSKTGDVYQQQGTNTGSATDGQDGRIDQATDDGVGRSKAQANENYAGKEHSNTDGVVTQNQDPHARCCSVQNGGNNNEFNINQNANLQADDPDAFQLESMEGTCDSPNGTCHVKQKITIDGQTSNNSCDGSFCDITNECTAGTPPDGGGDFAATAADPADCFTSSGGD